jgi:hypothetical protein
MEELRARLERLEAIEEIRQLVARYCFALDTRDLDALCGLFPEDVRVGKGRSGRRELKIWFDKTLREQFSGTAHFTGNHIIELDGAEAARGLVYSRNEHETGAEWVMMTMMYWDAYERVDSRWYFRRRLPLYWYASDLNAPPLGANKMRWPGREPYPGGFPDFFPTWERFWSEGFDADCDVPAPAPAEGFLSRVETLGDAFSVRVR